MKLYAVSVVWLKPRQWRDARRIHTLEFVQAENEESAKAEVIAKVMGESSRARIISCVAREITGDPTSEVVAFDQGDDDPEGEANPRHPLPLEVGEALRARPRWVSPPRPEEPREPEQGALPDA